MDNGTLFSKLSNEVKNENRTILENYKAELYCDLSIVEGFESLFKNLVTKISGCYYF